MDITGKIILALPEQSGVSQKGNSWKKRIYVLETIEQFPKKVAFTLFGDRADQYPLNVGDVKKVSYDLESREYNGRWYTDVNAWKVEDAVVDNASAPAAAPITSAPAPSPAPNPIDALSAGQAGIAPSSTDDLPF